jgi:hypothetical protein
MKNIDEVVRHARYSISRRRRRRLRLRASADLSRLRSPGFK